MQNQSSTAARTFECICEERFTTNQELSHHIKKVHGSPPPTQDNFCKDLNKNEKPQTLFISRILSLPKEKFPSFVGNSATRAHYQRAYVKRIKGECFYYICRCGKAFYSEPALKGHLDRLHTVRNYQLFFLDAEHLKVIIQVYMPSRRMKCYFVQKDGDQDCQVKQYRKVSVGYLQDKMVEEHQEVEEVEEYQLVNKVLTKLEEVIFCDRHKLEQEHFMHPFVDKFGPNEKLYICRCRMGFSKWHMLLTHLSKVHNILGVQKNECQKITFRYRFISREQNPQHRWGVKVFNTTKKNEFILKRDWRFFDNSVEDQLIKVQMQELTSMHRSFRDHEFIFGSKINKYVQLENIKRAKQAAEGVRIGVKCIKPPRQGESISIANENHTHKNNANSSVSLVGHPIGGDDRKDPYSDEDYQIEELDDEFQLQVLTKKDSAKDKEASQQAVLQVVNEQVSEKSGESEISKEDGHQFLSEKDLEPLNSQNMSKTESPKKASKLESYSSKMGEKSVLKLKEIFQYKMRNEFQNSASMHAPWLQGSSPNIY